MYEEKLKEYRLLKKFLENLLEEYAFEFEQGYGKAVIQGKIDGFGKIIQQLDSSN